jgi:hypothetical protein
MQYELTEYEMSLKQQLADLQDRIAALETERAELRAERDRWFLRTSAIIDAVGDDCSRGYCVLQDHDCVLGLEEARQAVIEALDTARKGE